MTNLRKKALAKLGYVECVCVKHDSMNDWYTIERAEHDGAAGWSPSTADIGSCTRGASPTPTSRATATRC